MGSGALVQCTFFANISPVGGNVSSDCSANITMDRCLVVGSVDGMGVYCDDSSTAALTCCNLYGNEAGDWVGNIADQADQDGNMCLDPLFCDPQSNDLTVDANSPCLPQNNECGELIGTFGQGCAFSPAVFPNAGFSLSQNYPNPFNPMTKISFTLAYPSRVQLAVFDLAGRRIQVLHDGFYASAGMQQIDWNGLDEQNRQMPSGTYFYRLDTPEFSQTRSMVLLR